MKLKYMAAFLLSLVLLAGCAGTFQRGPEGEPSPWQAGVKAAAEAYEESPWDTFGPWGVVVASTVAAMAGLQKGNQVYKARKAKREVPAE